ncbi:MAG: nuclear transport factor 2 family protein [Acidobacteria bacterium]|nr:nuclear transport factor 2 family protein [Acidobacteriota bacterium]
MNASAEVTRAISSRLLTLWDAWRNQDVTAHNAVLAEGYSAVHPDGTVHAGKPSSQEMAAAAITGYSLSGLRVALVGPEAALVTYVAQVEIPAGDHSEHAKLAVGEVLVKQRGEWLCRYYQGTLIK